MKTFEITLDDEYCDKLQKIAENRGSRIETDDDAVEIIQLLLESEISELAH